MMRGWEGTVKTRLFMVLPRKRVLFVLNLTHDRGHVQFSSVRRIGIFLCTFPLTAGWQNLSHQNTEVYATS